MTPHDVHQTTLAGSVLLDMRLPRVFAKEHVPGAVNLQFNRADLVDRAELVLPKDVPFIVHAEPEAIAKAAVELLSGAGYTVQGYLEGGLAAWKQAQLPTARTEVLGVEELQTRLEEVRVVDAREPFEYKHGHVPGAALLPWTEAWARAQAFTADRPMAVICGDEVRSALVASILARTRPDVSLVTGGMVDWNERGYAVEKGQAA